MHKVDEVYCRKKNCRRPVYHESVQPVVAIYCYDWVAGFRRPLLGRLLPTILVDSLFIFKV